MSEEYHKYSITTEWSWDWHLSTMSSDPVLSHMAHPIVVKISCFPQSLDFKCFSEQGVTNGSGMRQRRHQGESEAPHKQDRGWTRLIFLHREREREWAMCFLLGKDGG